MTTYTLRCRFIPQAWIGETAIEVDCEGPDQWICTVDKLPAPWDYESDNLRFEPSAPQWCRDWSGPFEVEYEEVEDVPQISEGCE